MTFIDPIGRPLSTPRQAMAVFFVSVDGDNWEPVKQYNVPAELLDHDVVACMMRGEMISIGDGNEGPWYRMERVDGL